MDETIVHSEPSAFTKWEAVGWRLGLPFLGAVTVAVALIYLLGSPDAWAVAAVLIAIGILIWSLFYTVRHRPWLLCSLVLIEALSGGSFIPLDADHKPVVRYALLALFCAPLAVEVWRIRSQFWQGNIRNYLFYLAWCAITIVYSLEPVISAGRLAVSAVIFAALVTLASAAETESDQNALYSRYLVGCITGLIALAIAAVVLPADLAWLLDLGVYRFRGFYDNPNQVGQLALATIAVGLVCWPKLRAGARILIVLAIIGAFLLTILADSRSPLVASAVGCGSYLIWRYRVRGLAICLVIALAVAAAATVATSDLELYVARGQVTTLTGRSDVWEYAVRKIEERPILGYGYQVEGAIFQLADFPSWDDVWSMGARSSVHNLYLAHVIGIGLPATLLWLAIYLWPWMSVFRNADDPWELKRIFFLIIIPILIHGLVESTAADCRDSVGILMMISWLFAERQRLKSIQDEELRSEQLRQRMSPAVAAAAGL